MTNPENSQKYEVRFWADAEVTKAEDNNESKEDR